MSLISVLRSITEHPYTNIAIALILMTTSLIEGGETLYEDITELNLGAHHGVLLFGIVSFLGSIPDLLEAVERLCATKSEA